ncbi:MAG: DUF1289 domain-containing protein [Alphaproteobacteria bacterium]|nr:DUF1289 domain-containing protein [Alphaproteobacteria bacterium]
MDDNIWSRDEVDSPCVKVCVIHEGSGICIGCHRTRPEIAGWSRMSGKDRQEVIAALPARAPLLRGVRKGRAGRGAVPRL